MTARRHPGSGAPGGPFVDFTFDGRHLTGVDGEPLAVSLLAAGESILSRSFRFHRPRGLMCSTGQCGWCECEVDGRPSVRTCRVPLRAGMVVRGEHALPSVRVDLLEALDLGSRFVPPTFYHHRFLRPRAFRKLYLDVLRWFGGRGRLSVRAAASAAPARSHRRERWDVVVVGAGPSGLAAAAAAAAEGADVLVLEADAPPFWTDPRPAPESGAASALAGRLVTREGTTAIGWYEGRLFATGAGGSWEIEAGALVSATGSYELVPPVPGADRPGVLSARLVSRLVDRHGVVPGRRAALVGEGADLERTAQTLRAAGVQVSGPYLTRDVVRVLGRSRVTGVRVRTAPHSSTVHTDLVVFSDRTPSIELLLGAGAAVAWHDGRLVPIVDEDGRTNAYAVFAVGSSAGRTGDPAASARAGRAAARAARETRRVSDPGATPTANRLAAAGSDAGQPPEHPVPRAMVCFCEDVRAWEIDREREAGYHHPELLKRRTGALTGPCQGKYCLVAVCAAGGLGLGAGTIGDALPTSRPPLRPVALADLADRDWASNAVEDGR